MDLLLALVYQHTLALLQTVAQNVPLIQNAQVTKHVFKKSVETHAWVHVVSMPYVLSSIIHLLAHAQNKIQAILSQIVIPNHLHVRLLVIFVSGFLLIIKNKIFHLAREPPRDDPCNPSPCGPNAQCSNGICTCLPEYQGDPYTMCRPECVINNDCPRDKACFNNKCKNPCPGPCGQNAICDVINHISMCSCPPGMSGNAFVQCSPYQCMYLSVQFFCLGI
jgi:hypothetical protein